MIRMRKEVPEIGWGDFAILRAARGRARAPLRLAQQFGRLSCTISACGRVTVKFRVGPAAEDNGTLVNLLSDDHSHADAPDVSGRVGALWVSVVSGGRAGLFAQAK